MPFTHKDQVLFAQFLTGFFLFIHHVIVFISSVANKLCWLLEVSEVIKKSRKQLTWKMFYSSPKYENSLGR